MNYNDIIEGATPFIRMAIVVAFIMSAIVVFV